MRHRTYVLERQITFFGYDVIDLAATTISMILFYQLVMSPLPLNALLEVLPSFGFAWLTLTGITRFRELAPPNLMVHTMAWLRSGDHLAVGPDTQNIPLVVPTTAKTAQRK